MPSELAASVAQASSTANAAAATPSILQHAARIASNARNPLASLLSESVALIVAVFNLTAAIVTFSTITVPSVVYAILHYSLTLQINFPSLAFLFVAALVTGLFWLRYGHLNRYERLREVPLEKDEGFNLHPDVNTSFFDGDARDGRGGANGGTFHNYLDDFLQAIRIFGFLEKPVFHELARHLQTRRLIAGDSLSLDSDFSFYIVIDGTVQVFAPLPGNKGNDAEEDPMSSAHGYEGLRHEDMGQDSFGLGFGAAQMGDDDDEEELSGYQLLHEVESGGTLSSLFTILSLFTEDVRLGFNDPAQSVATDAEVANSAYPGTPTTAPMSNTASASSLPGTAQPPPVRRMPPQLATPPEALYAHQGSAPTPLSLTPNLPRSPRAKGGFPTDSDTLEMPPAEASAPFPDTHAFSNKSATDRKRAAKLDSGPRTPSNILASLGSVPAHKGRTSVNGHSLHRLPATQSSQRSTGSQGHGKHDRHDTNELVNHFSRSRTRSGEHEQPRMPQSEGVGTVARATVDTTLAVIPAEAFKRLTKKYPNATAHIVQGEPLTRLIDFFGADAVAQSS